MAFDNVSSHEYKPVYKWELDMGVYCVSYLQICLVVPTDSLHCVELSIIALHNRNALSNPVHYQHRAPSISNRKIMCLIDSETEFKEWFQHCMADWMMCKIFLCCVIACGSGVWITCFFVSL